MIKKLYFAVSFLVLVLVFSFCSSCRIEKTIEKEIIKNVAEEKVVEEETKEEAPEEETEEGAKNISTEVTQVDSPKDAFLKKIKDYDIIYQATVYAGISYEIALDWSEDKITKEEASLKYLELATQVGKDFFSVGTFLELDIENITTEQKYIIELIEEWSTKTKYSYKYYSDFLDTGQAEYEIKTNELKEETDKIIDEYNKAIKEYIKE